ncbi:MAG: GGDEF domain-containing protein [Planctomycetes bacterium]|nr:GGDEF domain-containing protein [Planctomycetota bacterium]
MTQPSPRILAADHRGGALEGRVAHLVARAFEVGRSSSLRETLRQIGAVRPDVILLEPLTRSGSEEFEALDLARGDVPLLIQGERTDRELPLRAGRALASGTWDLLFRDAGDEEFELRLARLLAHGRLLREMDELRHRASHDDRTDLLRPQAFQTRVVEHFSAAQRHKLELALVLIDLDKFGAVNKRHDHTVGDLLIARVGEVIRRNKRTEDVAGRLGGDEFGLLLPYTGKINAAHVVSRLRSEIAKLSGHIEGAREDVPVSASIGFETFDGGDLDTLETLRKHAEVALRLAKRRGGDQGIYFRNMPAEGSEGS